MINKKAKEWVVLYDGFFDSEDGCADIHCAGVHEADLTIEKAHDLAEKRNNEGNGDIQFYVAHMTSNEAQKYL